jgi:glycosyltransferase involved in cell wall biosynthesis
MFCPLVISMLRPGPVGSLLQEAGIPTYSLEMSKGIFGITSQVRGIARLHRILSEQRPDLLISYLYHPIVTGRMVAKTAGIARVISCIRIAPRPTIAGRIQNLMLRLTSCADRVTTVNSAGVATQWVQKKAVSPEKLRIISNGVVVAEEEQQGSGEPSDNFVWCAIGRLEVQKDFFSLIAAMEIVARRYPDSRLRVIGDGPLKADLEAQVREKALTDHVVFQGTTADIDTLLSSASAVVLSSAWEGMPNVVLESLAAGVPVVATDVGGVREVVADGETGFLVPPHSAVHLADGMIRMMSLSREERGVMGQRGRELIRTRYTMDHVVRQWESLYIEVLEKE